MQTRTMICGMIALAISPVPARTMAATPAAVPQQVCALTGSRTEGPPLSDLSPLQVETLTRLCQALRAELAPAGLPPPEAELYLQLMGTSATGMTLRLLMRHAGQESAGAPLTLDTVDGPAPSDSSLRRMAQLLGATLPPPDR